MYNGIGLTTPRGSGTSGYVVRNLSTLRSHDKNDRPSTWDAAYPKHREPDQAILEHERKRKVEVKCLELQVELEDTGLDEVEIEKKVDELRQKLLTNLASTTGPQSLKPTDTHGMAAAKKIEVARMARALGTRPDYQEGDAFDREKQELNKLKRISEREEKEKRRAEDKARMAEQKAKWEAERRGREESLKKRKEDEDRINTRKDTMPPPTAPTGPRREYRDRDRPREDEFRSRRPRDSSPRGPPPSRDRHMPPPSPPRAAPMSRPKRERASLSRSPSPPARTRRRLDSRSPSRSLSRPRSPRSRSLSSHSRSPTRGVSKRSRSPVMRVVPPARRGRHLDSRSSISRSCSRSPSRSRSPPRRLRYRSSTPPPPSRNERTPPYLPTPAGPTREESMRQRGSYRDRPSRLPPVGASVKRDTSPIARRGRSRSRSVETGSSMSVSTRSGSGSRHEGRGKGRARH